MFFIVDKTDKLSSFNLITLSKLRLKVLALETQNKNFLKTVDVLKAHVNGNVMVYNDYMFTLYERV